MRLALAVLLCGLLLVVGDVHAQKPRRVALVIGNSTYAEGRLSNPGNDARLMERTLAGLGFSVRRVDDADFRALQREIREFGDRAKSAEVAFAYYAGHGAQHEGENFLVPIGARIEKSADVASEAVPASALLRQIESAGALVGIVVLDACRNSPFLGRVRSVSRGLARMDAPSGTIVAYAAQPGAVANDGKAGQNGLYTQHLVRFLSQPGLDIKQVFEQTAIAVERESEGKQRPREDIGLRGAFALAISPGAPLSPTTASPATARTPLPVAARVNGFEIPMAEVDLMSDLEARKTTPAGQSKATRGQLLDRLIDQALALQEVERRKIATVIAPLQSMPSDDVAGRAAFKEAQARKYTESLGASISAPTFQDQRKYFDSQPALFKDRKIYTLQEITIECEPKAVSGIRTALSEATNVGGFIEFLKKNNHRYTANEAIRAAEQVPMTSLPKLAAMKEGQAVWTESPTGAQLLVLAKAKSQPVNFETAKASIAQFLLNERKRQAVEADLTRMRAVASIQRLGPFAAGAVAAASGPAGR